MLFYATKCLWLCHPNSSTPAFFSHLLEGLAFGVSGLAFETLGLRSIILHAFVFGTCSL